MDEKELKPEELESVGGGGEPRREATAPPMADPELLIERHGPILPENEEWHLHSGR